MFQCLAMWFIERFTPKNMHLHEPMCPGGIICDEYCMWFEKSNKDVGIPTPCYSGLHQLVNESDEVSTTGQEVRHSL